MKEYTKPEVEVIIYQVTENIAASGNTGWQASGDFDMG